MTMPVDKAIDPNLILKALAGTSRDNPIKAKDLAGMIGYKTKAHLNETQMHLRGVITELLKAGHPIGANSRGFFMINNLVEYLFYIDSLDKRIRSNIERKMLTQQAFQAANPNKYVLRRKNE